MFKSKLLITLILSLFISMLHAKEYTDSCVKDDNVVPNYDFIIDVRTPEEFKFGHPKGAINIPYEFDKNGEKVLNKHFVEQVNRLTGDGYEKEIVLICRIGLRSVKAAILLADEGYEKLTNIQQGFVNGWKKAGLPVEKGAK
ncbi:MAG: rhodanese-like domain-containing protein [Campylobacterales bacterium]|nr:rhodanese-like domain-containing protein [Campylobacterales bacterium]